MSSSAPQVPGTFTVAELCAGVEDSIRQTFPDEVWVQGAISGITRSNNGHVYFDLVDPTDEMGVSTEAVLPVALFATTRHLVNKIMRKAGGIRMHDGIEIRIRGRVAYYPPQGRVQVVMSLIDPQFTLGQMVAAKGELLERLAADGLLDRNKEVAFPPLPLRVGLVTSNGSAAFADFVHEIELSRFPFAITLFDSRVQGLDAVPSLVAAIESTAEVDVDVVVVVRGGGSRTDLAAFDHERVATAIARCSRPVIVGVGHETDRSVADEVANVSAKTPTACAALLVEAVGAFAVRLDDASDRLASLAGQHLAGAQDRLVANGNRLASAANRVVDRQALALDHASSRLRREPALLLERAEQQLTATAAMLAALDPATALRRGWTITRTAEGELVRGADQVAAGTRLVTTTASGTIDSTVDGQGDDHPVEG